MRISEGRDIWNEYMESCIRRVDCLPPILALPLLFAAAIVGMILMTLLCPIRMWRS